MRPYGFDNEGFWAPLGINECIRVVKYSKGGHFEAHKDGTFVLDDDHRSIYTLQIYLSDDFEGGETIFYDEELKPPVEVRVTPVTGTALIFNHDVMHKGDAVTSKSHSKFIIRTDIMFQRTSKGKTEPLLKNPDFVQMDALYKKSIRLQQEGDPKGSTEAYLAAQKIQTQFPSLGVRGAPAVAVEGANWRLSYDVSLSIFQYLKVAELAVCCRVCKTWNSLASDQSLWRKIFFRRWPFNTKVENLMNVSSHLLDYARPWKLAFQQRLELEQNFVITFFDIGSQTTRYGVSRAFDPKKGRAVDGQDDDDDDDDDHDDEPKESGVVPSLPSIVARVKGHYWSARYGLEDYKVGPDIDEPYYRTYRPVVPFQPIPSDTNYESKMVLSNELITDEENGLLRFVPYLSYNDFRATLSTDRSTMIHWNAVRNICKWVGVHTSAMPDPNSFSPVLFAIPPFFKEKDIMLLDHMAKSQLQAPLVSYISAPVLALLAVGKKTGIVLLSGHNYTSITPVWEGGPIFEHEVILPYAGAILEAERKGKDAGKLDSKVASVFFPPDPTKNLAQLVFSAAMSCDEEKRGELLGCVLLAGGNTFTLENQFRLELALLASKTSHTPTVVVPEDRMGAIWLGAKQFCSYSGVRQFFSDGHHKEEDGKGRRY